MSLAPPRFLSRITERVSHTRRMARAEAAAAYLADQMGDGWRLGADGFWHDMPSLDAAAQAWGIPGTELGISGESLIGLAQHFGFEG